MIDGAPDITPAIAFSARSPALVGKARGISLFYVEKYIYI